MTEYAAGTVAVATVRGVPNVRVMRTNGTRGGDTLWFSAVHVAGWRSHMSRNVTDVRPLVVLDLAGMDVRGFIGHLRCCRFNGEREEWCEEVARQIEAQTKPPRIPEPGLWGVVQAAIPGGRIQSKWVRMLDGGPDEHWGNDEGDWSSWGDLIAPTLIRPGIEDES